MGNSRKVLRVCKCGNEFMVYPSRLAVGKGKFCSKECKLKYHTRRSGVKCNFKNGCSSWFKKGFVPWNKGRKQKDFRGKIV